MYISFQHLKQTLSLYFGRLTIIGIILVRFYPYSLYIVNRKKGYTLINKHWHFDFLDVKQYDELWLGIPSFLTMHCLICWPNIN